MIYFFILFIFLFFSELYGGSNIVASRKQFKYVHLVIFFGLLFLIGLRNKYIGTDTLTYIYEFEYSEIPINFNIFKYSEPLYKIALAISQLLFNNYTGFLCFFAFPFSLAYSNFIKKYSDDYFISVLIIIVLGTITFCMAGVRQSVALGFTIIAYQYARERKLISFLVCCLIAFGFHNSSIVIIFMYPLFMIKKINYKFWLLFIIAFILGFTKNKIIMQIANLFFVQDRYMMYGTTYQTNLNYTMLIIQLTLLIFCYIYKDKIITENKNNSSLFIMAFLSVIMQSFTPILGEFFRLSLYFSFSFCILVPKAIAIQKKIENKLILYYGTIFICLLYFFMSGDSIVLTYRPFWG